jgi:hypothetical protein
MLVGSGDVVDTTITVGVYVIPCTIQPPINAASWASHDADKPQAAGCYRPNSYHPVISALLAQHITAHHVLSTELIRQAATTREAKAKQKLPW